MRQLDFHIANETGESGGLKRKWAELEQIHGRQMSQIPYIVGVLEATPKYAQLWK
jgi:hypothetical protein